MEHMLEFGNSTLFALNKDKRGRTYVETMDFLKAGIYNIIVKGNLKETGNDEQRKSINERYGNFNYKTKLSVKVF